MIFLPWLLHRLIRRLGVYWDSEPLLNISGTMLLGLLIVVFAFGLAQPIAALASTATRNSIGIAVAVVLLSFLTMITRRKAMSQVVGFLSMENGLFFGAMSATYGMPMIVELGVALDVLVAMLVLGVFFFQIREQFDSLDLHHSSPQGEPSSSRLNRRRTVTWNSSLLLASPLAGALLLGAVRRAALGARAQRGVQPRDVPRRLRAHGARDRRRQSSRRRTSSSSSTRSTCFS